MFKFPNRIFNSIKISMWNLSLNSPKKYDDRINFRIEIFFLRSKCTLVYMKYPNIEWTIVEYVDATIKIFTREETWMETIARHLRFQRRCDHTIISIEPWRTNSSPSSERKTRKLRVRDISSRSGVAWRFTRCWRDPMGRIEMVRSLLRQKEGRKLSGGKNGKKRFSEWCWHLHNRPTRNWVVPRFHCARALASWKLATASSRFGQQKIVRRGIAHNFSTGAYICTYIYIYVYRSDWSVKYIYLSCYRWFEDNTCYYAESG